jgi:hypothetical protein
MTPACHFCGMDEPALLDHVIDNADGSPAWACRNAGACGFRITFHATMARLPKCSTCGAPHRGGGWAPAIGWHNATTTTTSKELRP